MKKILIGMVALVGVVVIAIVVGVALFLDSGIKRGVETLGPQLTKVDVKLDGVSVSLLSGTGKIKGLVVGNPAGYQTPHAIRVNAVTLALMPGSIFSDKAAQLQRMWVRVPARAPLDDFCPARYHERRINFISSLATKSRKDLSPGSSFNASMSSTHCSFDKHRRITSAILATAGSLTI